MSKRQNNFLQSVDVMTLVIYLSMIALGWLMVYTVGYDEDRTLADMAFDLSTNIGKQTLWVGVSLVLLMAVIAIDWNFWRTFAYPIYGITIASLIAVLFFGITIKGATSWFRIGPFTLQPAEFAKFGACLAMAAFLSAYDTNLGKRKHVFIALGIILLPMGLILLQSDAGSALVFLSFFIVMFREGLSPGLLLFGIGSATLLIMGLVFPLTYIVLGMSLILVLIMLRNVGSNYRWLLGFLLWAIGSIVAVSMGFAWYALGANGLVMMGLVYMMWKNRKIGLALRLVALLFLGTLFSGAAGYTFNNILEAHQQDRINVWLQPSKCDPRGALYNIIQSKMAIGSGGLQGKGFLQGDITKLNYVPEQNTDFIFCTIGEEQGFIGSIGIIGLFFLLMSRIVVIAERQNSAFSRQYAYGLAGILFIHFFVNIGMTMGLVPVIGIPLPFISYGGSCILAFTIMIGVLLKLDTKRLIG